MRSTFAGTRECGGVGSPDSRLRQSSLEGARVLLVYPVKLEKYIFGLWVLPIERFEYLLICAHGAMQCSIE